MNAWCDREVSREGYREVSREGYREVSREGYRKASHEGYRKASHEGYRTKHLTLNYRRLERHCTLEGLHFLSYLKTSSF